MDASSFRVRPSVHVYTCWRNVHDASYKIARPYQTGYHISVILDGVMWLSIDGRTYRVGAGDAVWFDLRRPYTYTFGENGRKTSRCYVRMSGTWADQLFRQAGFDQNPLVSTNEQDLLELEARFDLLVHLFARGAGSGSPEVDREACEIVHALARRRLPREEEWRIEHAPVDARVLLARRYIERNAYRELLLDEIVDHVHLTKFHFIRLFKRFTGLTPKQYLLHCRLVEARKLLLNTDMLVHEIAQRCGFSTSAHFSNTFKKVERVTPLAYRDRRAGPLHITGGSRD